MKYLFLFIFLIFQAHSGELVLVVRSDSPISVISKNELKKLYLGKSNIVQGKEFKAVNLNSRLRASEEFLSTYLGMSSQKFIKWWLKQQIIGRARPPIVVSSQEEASNEALKDINIIAYVNSSWVTDNHKKLTFID